MDIREEKKKSPEQGLEPWTLRLKVWCSTDWAIRALKEYVLPVYYNPIYSISIRYFDQSKVQKWYFRPNRDLNPGPSD